MADTLTVTDRHGREHFITRAHIADIFFTTGDEKPAGLFSPAEPESFEATITLAGGQVIQVGGDDARRLYEMIQREERPENPAADSPSGPADDERTEE